MFIEPTTVEDVKDKKKGGIHHILQEKKLLGVIAAVGDCVQVEGWSCAYG